MARIEHHDCRRMAVVLEGVAGALHERQHVDAKDLRACLEAADWVWKAGPSQPANRASEYDAARAILESNLSAAANGDPRAAAAIEREARRMARELRYLAAEAYERPPRQELPKAVDEAVARLAKKFARYSSQAAA